MSLRSAAFNVLSYICLALIFAMGLAVFAGTQSAGLFLTGYVLEWSLSVDNLIAFTAVFSYFGVKPEHRHRVLYWGIVGAVVARGAMVLLVGGPLFLFGRPVEAILACVVGWSAWKTMKGGDDEAGEIDHAARWYIKWARKWFPVTEFMTPWGSLFDQFGKATPAFMCLIAIEVTDVMFAFDSVPTVVSVTGNPFLSYSAMMFAILGLRSLYFVLEALQRYLTYLGTAVAIVLGFITVKLGLHAVFGYEFSATTSLAVVAGILATGIGISILFPGKETSNVG